MIYVLQIEDYRYIKIGYTADPKIENRIAALQTGCPYEIRPVLVVNGSLMEEKQLHAELAISMAKLNLKTPPNEWYPGRHHFIRLLLSELGLGPQSAINFARDYLATKRGGEPEAKMPKSTWDGSGKRWTPQDVEYRKKQEKVVQGLNGSVSEQLRYRADRQAKVARYIRP